MTKILHIAVLAFPFGSHAAALLDLAQRLAASAPPGVSFSFLSTPASNAKIFSKSTHSLIKPYDVWDGIMAEEATPQSPEQLIEMFLKATPDNFDVVVKKAESEIGVKVSCFLADAFLWFADDMAKEMSVPWLAFWVPGASSLSAHVHTDLIRAHFSVANKEENVKILPGLSAIRVADLPEGVVSGDLESPLSKMLQEMGTKLAGATAVAINSFEELEPLATSDLKPILKNVLNVGPSTITVPLSLSKSDDTSGCLKWLDNHEIGSVVYIGFGNVLVPPPTEIVALAEALDSSKIPFIWSLPDTMRSLLPNGFSEKTSGHGKIVAWAPQLQVLGHPSVGVYVTHCGFNSLMESIFCGVALIVRPLLGDNMMNCRLVEEVWKIGMRVKDGKFTKCGTMEALDSCLMFSDRGKEMRDNVGILRSRLLESTGPNGSSTQNFKAFSDLLLTT
ncbi:Kaempferol 3-O-beta-D-galactosyltransferase [Heracleum sosnowskyi]|uniref:Kaempferol 3-O-beta-D-galactosyltransferase n=1 Tax=Heracleum sosnowskyi TaxID=360622 RepID=A0AAD8JB31_9APIA|nr:Kaempferol 3-O-beta-D-galactosyltransferase [Heracleum sosnowskyi]KAK1399839.1 Kaempferol 3-O-beta-D-galactosyltransferase [Heracleum sosnowskyi]